MQPLLQVGTVVWDVVNIGAFDSQMDREYLYMLRGTLTISVLSNDGLTHGALPTEVQTLDVRALGSRQGMAIYPSSGLWVEDKVEYDEVNFN